MRTHMSTEARLYVWLRVDPDALKRNLPKGWEAQPATGFLRGANLAVVLIEGIAVSDTHGMPLPAVEHFAVVAVPARNEGVDSAAFIVIDGLAAPAASAPGAYGVYKPARVTIERRSNRESALSAAVEERWQFTSDIGDFINVRIVYDRGVGVRKRIEPRIYSGLKPDFYRIYKIEQVEDLVHTIYRDGPKAKNLEFSAAGGKLSELSADEDKIVGIVSMPTYYREIFLPEVAEEKAP